MAETTEALLVSESDLLPTIPSEAPTEEWDKIKTHVSLHEVKKTWKVFDFFHSPYKAYHVL